MKVQAGSKASVTASVFRIHQRNVLTPDLDDPAGVLKGQGACVRHVVLKSVEDLERPEIVALLDQALERQSPAPEGEGPLVIKSISPKQRARRP